MARKNGGTIHFTLRIKNRSRRREEAELELLQKSASSHRRLRGGYGILAQMASTFSISHCAIAALFVLTSHGIGEKATRAC